MALLSPLHQQTNNLFSMLHWKIGGKLLVTSALVILHIKSKCSQERRCLLHAFTRRCFGPCIFWESTGLWKNGRFVLLAKELEMDFRASRCLEFSNHMVMRGEKSWEEMVLIAEQKKAYRVGIDRRFY